LLDAHRCVVQRRVLTACVAPPLHVPKFKMEAPLGHSRCQSSRSLRSVPVARQDFLLSEAPCVSRTRMERGSNLSRYSTVKHSETAVKTKLNLVWSDCRDSLNLKQCIAREASYFDKRSSREKFVITLSAMARWTLHTPCGLMLPEKIFIDCVDGSKVIQVLYKDLQSTIRLNVSRTGPI
jgi:hypothetical protein